MTPTPNIADAGREINKAATSRAARINRERRVQRGITLVELLIGIAIGLLVVAIAMGALMVSYGVKGSVSDASNIQQQAAYAMRVIGGQLRQATSLYLNPNPSNAADGLDPLTPVAFEKKADPTSGTFNSFDLGNPASLLSSTGTSNLTVGFRRHKDPVFVRDPSTPADPLMALARNCLGYPANTSGDQRVESIFTLTNNELRCHGNGVAATQAQAIINNVANFQLTYLVQDATTTVGNPTLQRLATPPGGNWGQVQGVEVCLVLYGNERVDLSGVPAADRSYLDCDGTTLVDMTTAPAPRQNRMHLVFRNVFQLRSQGLM